MLSTQQHALAERALSEIDQLLNNFDLGGQIESALPLLLRHRRTLTELRNPSLSAVTATKPRDDERWADDIVTVFRDFSGQVRHAVLYRKMEELRKAAGRSWPENAEETIRATLQDHPDQFRMIHRGLWGLRVN